VPVGQSPFQIHSLTLNTQSAANTTNSQYNITTGINVVDYDCVLAGDYSTSIDIIESGRNRRKMWLYDSGGVWHVNIALGNHSNGNPNWTNTDIKVLCFSKTWTQWFGNPRNTNTNY
jgi:hypothetical protein